MSSFFVKFDSREKEITLKQARVIERSNPALVSLAALIFSCANVIHNQGANSSFCAHAKNLQFLFLSNIRFPSLLIFASKKKEGNKLALSFST